MPKVIAESVKIAVQDCTENAYFHYGKAETAQVQNYLAADYGIIFFDTPLLEKLIKEGLEDAKIQITC